MTGSPRRSATTTSADTFDHTFDAGEVAGDRDVVPAVRTQRLHDAGRLPLADFEHERRGLRSCRDALVETVTDERDPRLVLQLRLQADQRVDVRGVRDHEIPAVRGRRLVALPQLDLELQQLGVLAREAQ